MKTIALGKGIILCQSKIHKMLFKDDILLLYSLIINVKKSVLLAQSFYKAHEIYRMLYIPKNGKQTVKLFTV